MSDDSPAQKLWSLLGVSRELAADFVVVFARFEYALKRNRYLRDGEAAQPNWDRFASDLRKQCAPGELTDLLHSADYLTKYPTRKQLAREDRSLTWSEPEVGLKDVTGLLLAVRVTRNNLLHGGKFPIPAGPIPEPLRDERLISDCLAVLQRCLELDCDAARALKATFWDLEPAS